ncbi:PE-PPE domain-containing protein [Gordonia malaquae]|uniref:PE-PPE domain-containing protein n=1 Tax=Gordonia malaquae TaxID=410332 RepID=UPI00089D7DD7|nr:PE-PPE domain-containing protein [Gordonia malaquae]SEE57631.1 PE-PPE domain-containing protein [Gordonia malaquae]
MNIRRSGILVLLAAGLLSPMLPSNVGVTSAAPSCPQVMEFSTGGAAQPDGIRLGAMGKSVPADTQRTKVHYSASISPVGGNISGAESTAEGERNLRRAARSFRARCPESHIRLVGFSQGALVTGNVCNTFDSDPVMARNTSCVLYSDPRRPDPVRPGVMATLPSFVPGFPMMGPRPQTRNIRVTQVCQTNDGICAAPNPILDPIGFVNNLLGYLVYGAHGDYFAAPHTVDDGRLHTVRRTPYIPTADTPRPAPGSRRSTTYSTRSLACSSRPRRSRRRIGRHLWPHTSRPSSPGRCHHASVPLCCRRSRICRPSSSQSSRLSMPSSGPSPTPSTRSPFRSRGGRADSVDSGGRARHPGCRTGRDAAGATRS